MIVITDDGLEWPVLLQRVRAIATAGGPDVAIQHRAPGLPTRAFLERARALQEICSTAHVPLFINGRLDVALLVDGHLHLPSSGPDVADVRPHLPEGRWISVAVHDEAEARRAAGADLALVSPVFAPGSKPNDTRPPLGLQGLEQLTRTLSCPVWALGGVTPLVMRDVLGVGAAGAAVISAVMRADDPAAAASAFLSAV